MIDNGIDQLELIMQELPDYLAPELVPTRIDERRWEIDNVDGVPILIWRGRRAARAYVVAELGYAATNKALQVYEAMLMQNALSAGDLNPTMGLNDADDMVEMRFDIDVSRFTSKDFAEVVAEILTTAQRWKQFIETEELADTTEVERL